MVRTVFTFLFTLILSVAAMASPDAFVYQGQIIKPDGQALEASSVDFLIEVLSPGAEACLLYQESHTINMDNSNGIFSIQVGSGAREASADYEDVTPLLTALSNTTGLVTPTTCDSVGNYTPVLTDSRKLRVTFNDGTGPNTIDVDHEVVSVPFAASASSIDGMVSNDLIQVNTSTGYNLSQTNINAVFTDANWIELQALLDGSSTSFSGAGAFGNAVSVTGSSDAVQLTVSANGAQTANLIEFKDSGGSIVATVSSDGSVASATDLTTKNYVDTAAGSKLPLAGGTMSGGINMDSNTITNAGNISGTGSLSMNGISSGGTFALWNTGNFMGFQAPAGAADLIWTLPGVDGGSGQVLRTNGGGVLSWVNHSTSDLEDADGNTKIQVEEGVNDDTIRFDTASAERMVILPSGNVGIGTTNPERKLHVEYNGPNVAVFEKTDANSSSNTATLMSSNSAGVGVDGTINQLQYAVETKTEGVNEGLGALRFTGEDVTAGSIDSTFSIVNYNAGVSQIPLHIDSLGNVGIGTTDARTELGSTMGSNPRYLTIRSNGATDGSPSIIGLTNPIAVPTANSSVGSIQGALFSQGTTPNSRRIGIIGMRADGSTAGSYGGAIHLSVKPDGDNVTGLTEAMTIKNTGFVGIGTATPSGKLDIEGGDVFLGTGTLTNASGSEDLSVTGNIEADGAFYGDGSNLTGVVASSASAAASTDHFVINADSNSDNTGDIDFNVDGTTMGSIENNGDIIFDTNTLVVDASASKVGIGVLAPTNDLSFGGNVARLLGMERHPVGDTAGNDFSILAGGATTGATDKDGGDLYLQSGVATGTGSSNIYLQTSEAGGAGTTDNAVSTKMTILGNGNVGIGVTSPSSILHLRGATSPEFRIQDSGSSYPLILSNSGNTSRMYTTSGTNTWLYIDAVSGGSSASQIGFHRYGQSGTGSRTVAFYRGNNTTVVDHQIKSGNSSNTYFAAYGGNVGIGTTTPSGKLDIEGDDVFIGDTTLNNASADEDLVVKGNIEADGAFYGDGSNLTGVVASSTSAASNTDHFVINADSNSDNTGDIDFNIDGATMASVENNGDILFDTNTLVVDASANKLGIGVLAPTNDLSFGGNVARLLGMERHPVGDTAGNDFSILAGGATTGATDKDGGDLYLQSGVATGTGSSNIYLQTSEAGGAGATDNALSTKMTILGNGNVGIGTAVPNAGLEVESNIVSGSFTRSDTGSTNSLIGLNLVRSSSDGVGGTNIGIGMRFRSETSVEGNLSDLAIIRARATDPTDGAVDGTLQFLTTDAGVNSVKMAIDSTGNVGIGTTTPHDGKLVVHNSNTDEAYIAMDPGAAADNDIMGFRVSESGNNTTKLHIGREYTGDVSFQDFVTVDSTGNLGIGTDNPSGKLDVEGGDVFFGDTTLNNASGDEDLVVKGNIEADGAFYGDGSNLTGVVASSASAAASTDHFVINADSNSDNTGDIDFNVDGTTMASVENNGDFLVDTNTLVVDASANTVGISGATGTAGALNINTNSGLVPDIALEGNGVMSTEASFFLNIDADNDSTTGFFSVGKDAYATAGGTDLFRVQEDGNVGIGTASPSSLLEIKRNNATMTIEGRNGNSNSMGGALNIKGARQTAGNNFASINMYNYDGNGGASSTEFLGASVSAEKDDHDDAALTFSTATNMVLSEKMRISNAGNVGIGTTSPTQVLDVVGQSVVRPPSSPSGSNVLIGSPQSNVGIVYQLGDGAGARLNNWVTGVEDSDESFYIQERGSSGTTGTKHLVVSSGGNLGIGTTLPSETLDVSGNHLLVGSDVNGNTRTDSFQKLGVVSAPHYTNAEEDIFLIGSVSTPIANTVAVGGGRSSHNAATSIYFYTAPTLNTTNGNIAMMINGAGDVGIGTTTPSGKLDVEGGDVFLGTGTLTNASGSEDLSVTGNIEADGAFYGDGSNLTGVLASSTSAGSNASNFVINTDSDSSGSDGGIEFQVEGATVASIEDGGDFAVDSSTLYVESGGDRVGIGTDSPTRGKLQIEGVTTNNYAISAKTDPTGRGIEVLTTDFNFGSVGSALQFKLGAGTGDTYGIIEAEDIGKTSTASLVLQPSGGYVGIGTTSPSAKLHSMGNILVDKTGSGTDPVLGIRGDAGTYRSLLFSTGSLGRWAVSTSSHTEGGSDAGSDFRIRRFDDAGSYVDEPFMIQRSTGSVGIGTTSPASKLHVDGSGAGGGLCVTSDGTCTSVPAGGEISAETTLNTGADYAEYFEAEGDLESGDLVGFNKVSGKVRAYQLGDDLIGIVSTSPGVVGNSELANNENTVLVALVGQVPFDKKGVKIEEGFVKTIDGQAVGYLLASGNVYINLSSMDSKQERDIAAIKRDNDKKQKEIQELKRKNQSLEQRLQVIERLLQKGE